MGNREDAEQLLDLGLDALAADPRPTAPLRVLSPLGEPALHALRGDKEASLAALRAAIDRGPLIDSGRPASPGGWRDNPQMLLLNPHLKVLHDEPEFQSMVAEIGADLARMRQALVELDEAEAGRSPVVRGD